MYHVVDTSERYCGFPGCDRPYKAKGHCGGHYAQLNAGKPLKELQHRNLYSTCQYEDCDKDHFAKSYCAGHYYQWSMGYTLKPLTRQRTSEGTWFERATYALYQSMINLDDCHVWTGTKDRLGYGRIWFEKESWLVHRLSYVIKMNNKDACGHESVHHICANSSCFNPDHLRLVTQSENMAEMLARQSYLKEIQDLKTQIADLKLSKPQFTKMELYVLCA